MLVAFTSYSFLKEKGYAAKTTQTRKYALYPIHVYLGSVYTPEEGLIKDDAMKKNRIYLLYYSFSHLGQTLLALVEDYLLSYSATPIQVKPLHTSLYQRRLLKVFMSGLMLNY